MSECGDGGMGLLRTGLGLVSLVTSMAKALYGQVGDQVGQVKDQVSQGQGQELDNLQVSIFEKFTGGVVACLIIMSTPGPP